MLQLTQFVDNNALLTYSLTTAPTPVQVSPQQGPPSLASLTLVISCPISIDSVTVSQITFNLAVGDPSAPDATDLTDTAAGIKASVASTDSTQWQMGPGAASGVFVLTPLSGSGVIESQGLIITFIGIRVSGLVGTAVVKIIERATADTTPPQWRQCAVAVPKFPYGFYVTNFTAGTPQVPLGQSVTLTWEGSSNANYLLLYAGQSVGVTHQRSWTSPPLYTTTAFVLKVTAIVTQQTVSLDLSTTVTVAAPTIVTFKATPDCIAYNQPVVLSWHSANAEGVYLLTGESARESLPPNSDPNNPKTITPQYGVYYSLQAYTQSGEVSPESQLAITFNPLQISFTATPVEIDPFNLNRSVVEINAFTHSVTLDWNVANAVSVALQGQIVPAQGNRTVSPAVTTTYELAATWVDGTVTKQDLTVPNVNIKFNGATGTVVLNDKVITVTLTLQVENATVGSVLGAVMLCDLNARDKAVHSFVHADNWDGDTIQISNTEWQTTFNFSNTPFFAIESFPYFASIAISFYCSFSNPAKNPGGNYNGSQFVMLKGEATPWMKTFISSSYTN